MYILLRRGLLSEPLFDVLGVQVFSESEEPLHLLSICLSKQR